MPALQDAKTEDMEMKVSKPIFGTLVALTKNELMKICNEPDINSIFRINGQFQIFNPSRCLISKHCISDISPYSKVQKWKLTCLLNIFSVFPFRFCINPKINSWSAFPFLSLQEGTLFLFWATYEHSCLYYIQIWKWYKI